MFYPSIVENLARNAMKHPDKLCLADERKSMTYKEVWDSVCGLAMELDVRGVRRESCVMVECNQSADYMVCVFAIQLLKAIFVPLEKNMAAGRASEIARETEAVLLIGPRDIPGFTAPTDAASASMRPTDATAPPIQATDATAAPAQATDAAAAPLQRLDIDSVADFALGKVRDGIYRGAIEDLEVIGFPEPDDIAEILFSTTRVPESTRWETW